MKKKSNEEEEPDRQTNNKKNEGSPGKTVLHASSRRALKESKRCAITTSIDNVFHGVTTATVKKPARAAFVAVGLTKVRGWPLIDRSCGLN